MFAAFCLVLAAATYSRNIIWMDDILLWKDVTSKSASKARAYNDLAMAFYNAGLLDKAVTNYKKALALRPLPMIHSNLGVAYQQKGMVDEAIAEHRKALEMDPFYAQAHANLGIAYSEKGLYEDSISALKRAASLSPDLRIRRNLANAYRRAGRWQEALNEFNRLLKVADLPVLHNDLGLVYLGMADLYRAGREFERAIELDPSYADARINMGTVYMRRGKHAKALKSYLSALELAPDHPLVHYHLAVLYEKTGRYQDARRHYSRFIELAPLRYQDVVNMVREKLKHPEP